MSEERDLSGAIGGEDAADNGAAAGGEEEARLRPRAFAEYVGQQKTRRQLEIFIAAAAARGEALDHTLLFGPPGLGKTTLAHIIAAELGVAVRATSGPAVERVGDIAAILTSLEKNDVLFIDEIHRLPAVVEEAMYAALEDFFFDIVIGEGAAARSVKLDLQPFTLVGATTRAGALTSPLRDRFGITCRLDYYNEEEMTAIVRRSAGILKVETDEAGARQIAARSRRTPRVANRLLRRARDFAQVRGGGKITGDIAAAALELLEVDQAGLDSLDRRYLQTLLEKFEGGPVGVENLASALGESADTLESFVEPYLIKEGFVVRSPRGRAAAAAAYRHLQKKPPAASAPLFNKPAGESEGEK